MQKMKRMQKTQVFKRCETLKNANNEGNAGTA